MKKVLKYTFMFIIGFVFLENVYANQEITCKYEAVLVEDIGSQTKATLEIDLKLNADEMEIKRAEIFTTPYDKQDCIEKAKQNNKEHEAYCLNRKKTLSEKDINKIKFNLVEGDKCYNNLNLVEGVVSYNGSIFEILNYSVYPSDDGKFKLLSYEIIKTDKVYCGNQVQGRITQIPKKIPELTSLAITIIQIAVPVILVLMGSLDLFKGITAGKEDEMKKGQQLFVKRLIVGAVIFFVVVIAKFFISVVADTNSKNIVDCIDCFISNDCREER